MPTLQTQSHKQVPLFSCKRILCFNTLYDEAIKKPGAGLRVGGRNLLCSQHLGHHLVGTLMNYFYMRTKYDPNAALVAPCTNLKRLGFSEKMSTPVCTPRKHKAHAQVITDSPLVHIGLPVHHWFTDSHWGTSSQLGHREDLVSVSEKPRCTREYPDLLSINSKAWLRRVDLI